MIYANLTLKIQAICQTVMTYTTQGKIFYQFHSKILQNKKSIHKMTHKVVNTFKT